MSKMLPSSFSVYLISYMLIISCSNSVTPPVINKNCIAGNDLIGRWEYVGSLDIVDSIENTDTIKKIDGLTEFVEITNDSIIYYWQFEGNNCFRSLFLNYYLDCDTLKGNDHFSILDFYNGDTITMNTTVDVFQDTLRTSRNYLSKGILISKEQAFFKATFLSIPPIEFDTLCE